MKNHYRCKYSRPTTITVNLGTSDLTHIMLEVVKLQTCYGEIVISNAVYNNSTGVCTITTTHHGYLTSDVIKLSGLQYTTTEGDKILQKLVNLCIHVLVQW
ncbi:MAG: hypothetical protein CM15mV8_0710 [Caudoviricetes sp.]|nr:MAG: hypothetical protein CM15mV8_0710 [Caudoviricetes sp.]